MHRKVIEMESSDSKDCMFHGEMQPTNRVFSHITSQLQLIHMEQVGRQETGLIVVLNGIPLY